MRKIRKKLTQDQIDRGVIFSSCLSKITTEEHDGTIHEVLGSDKEGGATIERLLNDSFFNSSPLEIQYNKGGLKCIYTI